MKIKYKEADHKKVSANEHYVSEIEFEEYWKKSQINSNHFDERYNIAEVTDDILEDISMFGYAMVTLDSGTKVKFTNSETGFCYYNENRGWFGPCKTRNEIYALIKQIT